MTWRVIVGDALERLRELPAESVQCVVTSPPYWGLRDYGTAAWEGGDAGCSHVAGPAVSAKSTLGGGKQPDVFMPVRGQCSCGAVRQDRQLGLEPTPELYVEHMVEVFREVRRVLRKDGTVWLNLGDSYAAQGHEKRTASERMARTTLNGPGELVPGSAATKYEDNVERHVQRTVPPGLKPKDLVGIPWRVAFALQQPYYTGKIRQERDRIWLAAMVEAEGCLFLHKRKVGMSNGQGYVRKADSYGAGLEVANTSEAIVRRCMEIAGGRGSISRQDKDRRQPLFRWSMRSNECRDVIRELYPYFVAKQQQARLLLGCPSSGPKAEQAHASLIALHNGADPTIDFPPPPPMYEPGWYVRSDVIWSKLNPMPESVTDRPTKAHEYVFLLTKSARYFWDADAVRETHARDYGDDFGVGVNGDYSVVGRQDGKGWRGDGGFKTSIPNPAGRNLRTVWNIATEPFPQAHFATFPTALVEPCIKAGTSEKGCCPECRAPWERMRGGAASEPQRENYHGQGVVPEHRGGGDRVGGFYPDYVTLGWRPSCNCEPAPSYGDAWPPVPCTVLDPFAGSGTVGVVACQLGRSFIGIELNPVYAEMAERRIHNEAGLFSVQDSVK